MNRDMTIDEFFDIHQVPEETSKLFQAFYLQSKGNYDKCREWAIANCKTLQECWDTIPDSYGLVWLASKPNVLTPEERLKFVLFCCELLRPQLNNLLSAFAINTLQRWVKGEATLLELKVASYVAEDAWDGASDMYDEDTGSAEAAVAMAVRVSPDADSFEIANILEVAEWANGADIAWDTLADCLRTHAKPNFTKKED